MKKVLLIISIFLLLVGCSNQKNDFLSSIDQTDQLIFDEKNYDVYTETHDGLTFSFYMEKGPYYEDQHISMFTILYSDEPVVIESADPLVGYNIVNSDGLQLQSSIFFTILVTSEIQAKTYYVMPFFKSGSFSTDDKEMTEAYLSEPSTLLGKNSYDITVVPSFNIKNGEDFKGFTVSIEVN